MSIEYKLIKDNNKNPINDSFFITDVNNKYIIFKSVVTSENNENNEQIFIEKLKKLIDTKFSEEDTKIAKNNLISFFINQTNNYDDNELISYKYNNTSISILMNSSMMKNWSLDNYNTREVNMDRKDFTGGSGSNQYARNRHRYTGGGICQDLIPDNDELLDIYHNNKFFETIKQNRLMLEYLDIHQKELEIYYAIKNDKKLEQFLNKIPFSSLRKQ